MTSVLLAWAKKPEINVTAHADLVTSLLLAVLFLIVAFFLVRPELWRRLFFDRIDPRPAALLRIAFGTVLLWTFLDLIPTARMLFTDEGLWLTEMARKNYGGRLKTLWDPVEGFEHWYDVSRALWGRFTILHVRSDPAFVYTIYGALLVSLVAMILGIWTRVMTIVVWILSEQLYRYSPIFYTGGDTVTRCFMFLSIFVAWGEAYSLDSWWRRRKAILGGAVEVPPLQRIPAWPLRLMMLQLSIIYCATGLLKSGGTWMKGTALYYALNLDHFYRYPMTEVVTFFQWIGVLPATTWLVRYWEVLFPLALVGAAVNAQIRERRAGTWVEAPGWRRGVSWLVFAVAWGIVSYVAGVGAHYYIPRPEERLGLTPEQLLPLVAGGVALIPVVVVPLWRVIRTKTPKIFDFVRFWLLGKRFWLTVGLAMHVGIDLGMNVGTFAEVMMAVYFAWLTGPELDNFWRWLGTRPLKPGEDRRPRIKGIFGLVMAPAHRFRFREKRPSYLVHHNPDEASVRRVALLRIWDLADRLRFVADADVPTQTLVIETPDGDKRRGTEAAATLTPLFPGLWWLAWMVPIGLTAVAGGIAKSILRQR